MLFRDRVEAGKRLGIQLQSEFTDRDDILVLALPRGGVPVGFEVARMLNAPLDVFVVRKLGVPGHEELALGAIASGGIRVLNDDVVEGLNISVQQIDTITARELIELERREHQYRGARGSPEVNGKAVILVDDGLATGSTMRAAVAALRQEKAREVTVAVPVAARSTCQEMAREADRVICLYTPFDFQAVGQWYKEFSQTSNEEVRDLLRRAGTSSQRAA